MMPWAKFDDRLHTHRKIMQIDNDAMAVWVCSVTYCSENLTDGFLTERDADRLLGLRNAPKQVLEQLLQVCLWEKTPNGYHVHDYLDYNPSKEDAEKLKDERAQAGSLGGKRSGEVRRSKAEAKREANALANAEANGKQNRTPYPDPVPMTPSVVTNVTTDGADAPAQRGVLDRLKFYEERVAADVDGKKAVAIVGDAFHEVFQYKTNYGRIAAILKIYDGPFEIVKLIFGALPGWNRTDDPHDYLTKIVQGRKDKSNSKRASPGGRAVDRSSLNGAGTDYEKLLRERDERERRERENAGAPT